MAQLSRVHASLLLIRSCVAPKMEFSDNALTNHKGCEAVLLVRYMVNGLHITHENTWLTTISYMLNSVLIQWVITMVKIEMAITAKVSVRLD